MQFLPVSLSKSKTHFSLQLLAVNKSHKAATSCQSWHSLLLLVPHPRRAHVYASAQLRSRMSETFSFAVCAVSFQSSKMRPGARRGPLLLSHSSSDYGTSQRSHYFQLNQRKPQTGQGHPHVCSLGLALTAVCSIGWGQ